MKQTEAAQTNHLDGEYEMHVTSTDVGLRTVNPQSDTVITWPLRQITKFKSEELGPDKGELVTLEASV